MSWILPGTQIEIRKEDAGHVDELFGSMFLAGGMVLSQVSSVTGLEPYTVQNWVKRGFLPPPQRKRYSMDQVCRVININMLKGVLPMEQICGLLSYINGILDDDSDDIIRDSQLYFLFVGLAAREELSEDRWAQALGDYVESVPGARERIEKALRIMLTAWTAAQMRQEAERMLAEL